MTCAAGFIVGSYSPDRIRFRYLFSMTSVNSGVWATWLFCVRWVRLMLPHTKSSNRITLRVLPPALWAMVVTLLVLRSMNLGFPDHDEHQFVASATLLARHGLLPYRDYPYFHVPYLVFVDAGLFRITPYLLLAAQFFSALSVCEQRSAFYISTRAS